ncbi:MAG: hypothetical protein K940chlam3_00790 [Chlamydiae bacterium]|nr:hypothetical protein [Chlamydiota bacterium]
MAVHLASSVIGGCREYFTTQDAMFRGIELINTMIPCLPSNEGLENLKELFDNHQNIHDCFQMVPDSLRAISAKTIQNCKEHKFLELATTINGLFLSTLCLTAGAGAVKLVDLGKLAASIGQFEIFGVNPLKSIVAIPLLPAIRISYISVLALSGFQALRTYRENCDNTLVDGAKRKAETARREALWAVARNTMRIALQVICLVGCASIPTLIAVGVVASVTGMAARIVATDSMREYFNPNYTKNDPTH